MGESVRDDLFCDQDKDAGHIGRQDRIEPAARKGIDLVKLSFRLGGERLRELASVQRLHDLDPFPLTISVGVIPVQYSQLIDGYEGVVQLNAAPIGQIRHDLTAAQDRHIHSQQVRDAGRQWGGQFICANSTQQGLLIAQIVERNLDAPDPVDTIAIQIDWPVACQRDDSAGVRRDYLAGSLR
jgi:hypothetical protein